jgi:hypothetical protein
MIILIFVVGIGGFQGIRLLSIPINTRFSNEKASSSSSSSSSSSTSLNANPRKIDVGSDNGFQANVRVIIVYILTNYYYYFSCSPYKFDLIYIYYTNN